MSSQHLYGSVEAGGTKFVCAVSDDQLSLVEQAQFPTTDPKTTIEQLIEFFLPFREELRGLSIASFGPIDLITSSPTYGYITSTPKPGWQDTDLVSPIKSALACPIYFTTDVNASAYGEMKARKVSNLVYYTIGTGIGGGVIINEELIGGVGHLELGHVYVAKHPQDSTFEGVCPYHGACLEGLAAGPSLEKRLGIRGEDVSVDHDIWEIEAYYIAQAAIQATLSYRPEIIVFGGGVMGQEHMLDRVKKQFQKLLNNYVEIPLLDDYLVLPHYDGNASATYGNFLLARSLAN